MLLTNTTFDTAHALDYKSPMYLIQFDGEATDYCNHEPGYPTNALKQYLGDISGTDQVVYPEDGRATISGVTFELLDYDNEITALLSTDTYFFHRKKTTIKAGYRGMNEYSMLTIFVGWVTGLKLSSDGLSYIFSITDPKKWMQRKIFRGAEDASVTISGNPINILLAVLTSTGAGTNGDYDWYAAVNGLGLDVTYINITNLEDVRDKWFPGNSHYMRFVIDKRLKAIDWFENEIFRPLNIYPVIDGDGKFNIKPFKPPIAAYTQIQSYNEDNIIGLPDWDMNLEGMFNEVEWFYNWDDVNEEFADEAFYVDATSVDNRGAGKKPVTIKSKGLHTSISGVSLNLYTADVIIRRKNAIFNRFATPPLEIGAKTFFSRWLSEAGDIVPFTHGNLPDVSAGTRGLTTERLEIIRRSVDWKRGGVSIDFLNTGFDKGDYGAISPTMTVTAGTNGENFTVSTADAAKYANYTTPEIQLLNSHGRVKVAARTLLTVDSGTGVCTCDDWGLTPVAGDIVMFADYDSCTVDQKQYSFHANASYKLGAANDDADLIIP